VQDKWPKVRVVLVTKEYKTRFGILRWNSGGENRIYDQSLDFDGLKTDNFARPGKIWQARMNLQ